MNPESIKGLIWKEEGEFLQKLVRESLPELKIRYLMEIGSYKGKSTAYTTAVTGKRDVMFCLENFAMPGANERSLRRVLNDAIKHGRLADWFIYTDRLLTFPNLAFLFIDGDHTYPQIRIDAMLAGLVLPGGWVAFHDAMGGFPDVRNQVRNLLFLGDIGYWEEIRFCGSIVAAKVARPGHPTTYQYLIMKLKYQFWKIAGWYLRHIKYKIPNSVHVWIRKTYSRWF